MYTVALKSCETGGLWKQALVLREQMTTLLGQEAVDEITASLTARQRKHWERKEKKSDEQE